MRALKIEHRKHTLIEIDNSTPRKELDALHKEIGGYIELVRLSRDAAMIVDEEGLIKGLWQNPLASLVAGRLIVGTALIVGMVGSPDGDLCTDVPQRFLDRFEDNIFAEYEV